MLQLSQAGKTFWAQDSCFEDCDWLITPKEQVGLVGANGTGKSTLLTVLAAWKARLRSTTASAMIRSGYLPQDGLSLTGRTVFAECMSVFQDLHAMEQELEDLDHVSARWFRRARDTAALPTVCITSIPSFGIATAMLSRLQVGAVLNGLGFQQGDWQRRTEEFSGGWQMRIALAKLLLRKTQPAAARRADQSSGSGSSQLARRVSRQLSVCFRADLARSLLSGRHGEPHRRNLEQEGLDFYTGNYEKYLTQKTERRAQLEAAYRNQRERIEQLEAFINRFRYQATKAKQVQSRIKELDKIERIEIPPEERAIHFSFPQPQASGRIVAEFKNVSKSYGPKVVFSTPASSSNAAIALHWSA